MTRSTTQTRGLTPISDPFAGHAGDDDAAPPTPAPDVAHAAIARRTTAGPAPLSSAQKRLWFLDQLAPGHGGASVALALHLGGPLDAAALQRALDVVVARHEALRTRVTVDGDGEPRQVVDPDARVVLRIEELPGDPSPPNGSSHQADDDAALTARLGAEVRRPFDLAEAPLVRALLVRRAPESHVFLLVVHHVVFDAASRGIVRRELADAYGAALHGAPWTPAEPPVQMSDYAVWQSGDAAQAAMAADEAYWVATLDGAPRVLDIPREPGSASATVSARAPAAVVALLPPAAASAVRARARGEGVTRFIVLLTAFEAAVARFTARNDFLVGVIVGGRTRPELQSTVGCFVNTLPLRARTDGDPTLRALLARAGTSAAGALAHQLVPFERLVERLNPTRGGVSMPLVQATLNFRNAPRGEAPVPGLVVSALVPPEEPQTAGLSLDVDDEADGMRLVLSYDAARLTAATAAALLADFRLVLDAVAADPEQHLSALPRSAARARVDARVERSRATPTHAAPSDERVAFEALYARSNLTAMQLLMWLHAQRHPDVPLYNQTGIRVWDHAIEPAALGRAFAGVVARSDALRTTVAERDGAPWQTVHPPEARPVAIEVLDFSDRPDPARALDAWAAARAAVPLDLTRCAYDAALVRLGPARTAWYLATHHAVTDGWLRVLVQRELFEDYKSELAGTPTADRAAAPPFADVVAAERTAAGSEAARDAAAYWAAERTAPTERVRPYGRRAQGGVARVTRVSVSLGAERTARLRALAERGAGDRAAEGAAGAAMRAHVAAANLCAAAVCGALHRVGGGSAVTLGIPMHNRRTDALRRTHGLVMSMVPVRVAVDGEARFADLARTLAATTVAAGVHAAHGAAALEADRVDAVFNYHPPASLTAGGSSAWLHPGWASEALAVSLHDYLGQGSLTLALDFREDVYDAPTRELAARHLLAALDAMLADPRARVGDVDLLTADERRRVLDVPNATAVPLPEAVTALDLVERQRRTTPGAAAVWQPAAGGGATALTYAELWTEAERIAGELRRLGVRRGDAVGLLLGRSAALVAAMLGVMRAGAAYVPLDPAYPEARLALMARDAGLTLCLTERGLLDRLPADAVRAVCLDALDGGEPDAAGDARCAPTRDDLAYVLYTSGSTGAPKGVEITHAGLLNFVADVARRFSLGPGDRMLQFASPSFDTAVEEIFPALASGAAVVLRDDAWLASMPAFVARCADAGITACSLPTAFWHELTDALARGTVALPACLRLVLVGGERMRPDRLADWRRIVGPRVALWNGYGPTEATVVTNYRDLTPGVEGAAAVDGSADVPIGPPMSNARAYVLDAARRPAPVGVPGELYVGGIGLARGYRGQPALTAERFVDDPFTPGARLYRTGDVARVRPDGEFEVIGRTDAQVKVRGFRVEPGEVEAALLGVRGVRHAAVIADATEAGDVQLTACVVLAPPAGDAASTTPRAIRNALARALPAFAVPAAIVVVDAIPLTVNGKVDRAALHGAGRSVGQRGAVPGSSDSAPVPTPRTLVAAMLVPIWEELLGVHPIGERDDFFALGGHSLLAIRMLARVEQLTGHSVPITALYRDATIERLESLLVAAAVGRPGAAGVEPVTAVQPGGGRTPLFWLHGDYGGGGLYCRRLAALLGPDQPFYAVHPLGMSGDPVPLRLEAMAVQHVAAIRAVRTRGPYRLGGHCNGGVLAFEVARRLRADGDDVEAVVMAGARTRDVRFPAIHRTRLRVSRPLGQAARRWLGLSPLPDVPAPHDPDRLHALGQLYGAALWTYVPRRYGGRVVLLVTADVAPDMRTRIEAAWRRAAPALEVYVVPGDHHSYVARHADALAARLRSVFDGAA